MAWRFYKMKQNDSLKRLYALGRLKAGQMNKTEALYAEDLRTREIAGEIVWWKFEGVKLKLADLTYYSPDFAVMLANGQIELHEVKGFWRDDARVKIKVAAEQFPLRFVAVQKLPKKAGGGWKTEEF